MIYIPYGGDDHALIRLRVESMFEAMAFGAITRANSADLHLVARVFISHEVTSHFVAILPSKSRHMPFISCFNLFGVFCCLPRWQQHYSCSF